MNLVGVATPKEPNSGSGSDSNQNGSTGSSEAATPEAAASKNQAKGRNAR